MILRLRTRLYSETKGKAATSVTTSIKSQKAIDPTSYDVKQWYLHYNGSASNSVPLHEILIYGAGQKRPDVSETR